MSKVSRPPLRVLRRGASAGLVSLLRAHAALALAFALVASLAPLGSVARAQGAPEAQLLVDEAGPVYFIYQTPEGEVECRLATPAEIESIGEPERQLPLRQINHLQAKDSATASASAGLTIILRGTEQLEANPEAKQAFINAAAKWESVISSQITVTIDVDYGTTFFGQAYSSDTTIGATSSGGYRVFYDDPTRGSLRSRLINRAPAGSEERALLNSLPASSLPTDIGNVTDVFIPPAIARALGYSIDEATAPVPRIGFNSKFAFDFNPNDGVNSTQTDFDSVAVHEIGHALGFNSMVGERELDPTRALRVTVWDLYRFRPGAGTPGTFSVASRVLSSGTSSTDPHVHFNGGAELALSTGKPDGTGGDERQASHWKDDRLGGVFVGIMDPTIPRGRHEKITDNDLKAIDFFGYSVGQQQQQGGPSVQFGAQSYAASETQRSAAITITRSGDTAAAASVDVRTVDNPAAVACNDTSTLPGVAFARCDYATTIETVTFAAGQTAKTVIVPLIDDTYGEPTETVQLSLSNPAGAALGAQATTTLQILSDEAPGQDGATNPVEGVPFFVRQHYLDFLSREPEAGEPWSGVLNNCADQFNQSTTSSSAGCDRIIVSSSFFGSPEFELKGRYAFRFYKVAFGRFPEYAEIVADMRQLSGATGDEVIAKRAAFPAAFMQHPHFAPLFGALSNEQFVNTLMNRYGLQIVNSFHPSSPEGGAKIGFERSALVTSLNAGQFTRAQVLRIIADSDEVSAAEFRPSFVAMQYYGYLRRTPEPSGYQAWLNYLNANPSDSRTMVNGFLNSQEYRLRFGRP